MKNCDPNEKYIVNGIIAIMEMSMKKAKLPLLRRPIARRPSTSMTEAGLPLEGGGVLGKVRFSRAATRAVPAPQYSGMAVPSILAPLKNLSATRLNTMADAQPIDPNTRI